MTTTDGDSDGDEPVELLDLLNEDSCLRVQRKRCGTCIFWDDNRMRLAPGYREQMVADADAADGFITCHQTLPYSPYEAPPAVCHGYWSHAKWTSFRLRVALILEAVAYVEPPSTTWNNPDRSIMDTEKHPVDTERLDQAAERLNIDIGAASETHPARAIALWAVEHFNKEDPADWQHASGAFIAYLGDEIDRGMSDRLAGGSVMAAAAAMRLTESTSAVAIGNEVPEPTTRLEYLACQWVEAALVMLVREYYRSEHTEGAQ